jgi:CCR4-NOT transcription complex subunit 6
MRMLNVNRFNGGVQLSVLSYNMLASSFALPKYFPASNPAHLEWSNRMKSFETQFTNINADLVCLQELEERDFNTWLNPYMNSIGYHGIMCRKTRDLLGDDSQDGCATFYKADRFSLLSEHRIDYTNSVKSILKSFKDEKSAGAFALPVHNVATLVQLEMKDSSNLWIINTHLHWNRKNPHTQLYQVKTLLAELSRLNPGEPFIICGDFNSLPGSAVHEYLSNGFIDAKSNNYGTLYETYSSLFATDDLVKAYMDQKSGIQSIKSAYRDETVTMPYSNFVVDKFQGVIDYIWYSGDQLQTLALAKEENYDHIVSLPDEQHPSDHLPLVAQFEVIKKK